MNIRLSVPRVILAIAMLMLFALNALHLGEWSTVAAAAGNVYYVATNGNDSNPGTLSQPWRTIQKAADTMVGGDTVNIRGGTYNERVKMEFRGNSAGPYITFAAYPGETVTLDGTGIDISYGGGLFHIWSTNYIRITGLKLQKSNGAGIYVAYSNNIKVENNRTYDTVKSGIGIWGSRQVVVDGNDIALACNPHVGYSQSEENLTIDSSSYVEVLNNRAHDGPTGLDRARAGGEGIAAKNNSSNVRFYSNVVYNLDKLGFGLDAWAPDPNDPTKTSHDIDFFSNIAHNVYYGFMVSSEQGGTDENIRFYNNIAYNNTGAGFAIPWWSGTKDGPKRNIQFVNNTAVGNDLGLSIQSTQNVGVIVRNNILSQNGTSISIIPGALAQTTVDHNLFYGSGGILGTSAVVGNPLFINPSIGDFHLQIGSPAIDTGSSASAPSIDFYGFPRPQGAGYDIGAVERQLASKYYYLPLVLRNAP